MASRPFAAGMRDVLDLVAKHDDWRLRRTINLIPSENVTSEQVRSILASDLGTDTRYRGGRSGTGTSSRTRIAGRGTWTRSRSSGGGSRGRCSAPATRP